MSPRARIPYEERPELAQQVAVSLWFHRQLNHLSQQQLGELLGMRQPQIARLESGFVNPTLDTLVRISEKLGIEISIEVKAGVLTASATPPGRLTHPENRPA
jgi:transcriptional regulator with XRE-family HTH domain